MSALTKGLIASLVLSVSASGQEVAGSGSSPANASLLQAKVREWVEAQKVLSEEAATWKEQKQSLSDLNELRKKEIAQLDTVIEAAGKRLTDAETKKAELAAEEEALRQTRGELEQRVTALEKTLREQESQFPRPLRDKLAAELERLSAAAEDTPLQNRFRDALVILGAANEFHNSITVDSEIRSFGADRVEIDVLYLGFSGAWYVDKTGERSGTGKVQSEGWVWNEDSSISGNVRNAIMMYQRQTTPGFVELPFSSGGKGGGE